MVDLNKGIVLKRTMSSIFGERQIEGAKAVWLQPVRLPDALNRARADANRAGETARLVACTLETIAPLSDDPVVSLPALGRLTARPTPVIAAITLDLTKSRDMTEICRRDAEVTLVTSDAEAFPISNNSLILMIIIQVEGSCKCDLVC